MKFKNTGKDTKVRIDESNGHRWITVKTGQVVDILEATGKRNNFEIVEEVKFETKEVLKKKVVKGKTTKKSTKKE